ncbi:MAG: hypothetical protein ABI395_05520 [Sphingobium sp.]
MPDEVADVDTGFVPAVPCSERVRDMPTTDNIAGPGVRQATISVIANAISRWSLFVTP